MKNIQKIALIIFVFLAVSCGNDEKQETTSTSNPLGVKMSLKPRNTNIHFVSVSGKIDAVNSANISTRIMGFVSNIHVNVGDVVKKGQLLIAINNSDLKAKKAQIEARILEAKAVFKNAEINYNRFKNLFESNSASEKEMDDMIVGFEIAKAMLESAKQQQKEIDAQFTYSNLTAPFSGVITNKYIKEGDMASPGTPLIGIETQQEFEVSALVPESEISHIKKGEEVQVSIKSIGATVSGKITEISNSSKNTGGQYVIKIQLNKTDKKILSGMFVSVKIPINNTSVQQEMVLVPLKSLIHKGQLSGVYTVSQHNTAILRWLRLGKTYGENIEVLSGLSINEPYIVSAEGKLYNGAKVSIQ